MAHDIASINGRDASMSANGVTPWHKLGTVLPHAPTAAEAMHAANLDWAVRKVPACHIGSDGLVREVDGAYALVRDVDNYGLGVVGAVYKVVQNADAFDFVDSLIGSGEVRYETAGALNNGRKIWLMARMTEADIVLPGDDKVIPYLLFTNTHDGSESVDVRLCTTRVVCANTLAIALREGRSHYRIQHRGDVRGKMETAREVLGMARNRVAQIGDMFSLLAETPMSDEDFGFILNGLVGIDGDVKPTTRALNIKAEIQNIRGNGAGSSLPSAKGTAWGALNAVTEYVTHYRSTRGAGRGGNPLVAEANRLESSAYGSGAKMASEALDAIMEATAKHWEGAALIADMVEAQQTASV